MLRLARIVLIVPLAIAGLLTLLSAQSALIVGALMFGLNRRASPGKARKTPAQAPAEPWPVAAPAEDEYARGAPAEPVSFLPLRPIKPDSIVLLPGEECYLQETAQLNLKRELHRIGGPRQLLDGTLSK